MVKEFSTVLAHLAELSSIWSESPSLVYREEEPPATKFEKVPIEKKNCQ